MAIEELVIGEVAALRLRTNPAKRYKEVVNATVLIWKWLLVAVQRFRELAAPEKMKQVFWDVEYRDGLVAKQEVVLAVA